MIDSALCSFRAIVTWSSASMSQTVSAVDSHATHVDAFEDGAQERQVGFEDHDHAGAAESFGEPLDVVAGPEADCDDHGVFDEVDALEQAVRLLDGAVSTAQGATIEFRHGPAVGGPRPGEVSVVPRPA